MTNTYRIRMSAAIQAWMIDLNNYPGWRAWKRQQLGHTLYFDDPIPWRADKIETEFKFSDELQKQHDIIMQYLGLEEAIQSLKECQFYFRRYPFRGLPVSRHSHITNICEMYFSRFYELKERLKKYLNCVGSISSKKCPEIGLFLKYFQKEFDHELRERNNIHHHGRFTDIGIDRIFLTDVISADKDESGWKAEHLIAYRKLSQSWVKRVHRRGEKMDELLEGVARFTIANCCFLRAPASVDVSGTAR